MARARAQASDLAERLRTLGAHVSEIPAVDAELRDSDPDLQAAVTSRPDWLVLSAVASVAAVLLAAIEAAGADIRVLGSTRIAAFGQGTVARLRDFGLRPDFVPSKATLAAVSAELTLEAGERVVFATAQAANPDAAETLRARGANVTRIAAFAEVARPIDDQQRREFLDADLVVFTSASTVANLHEALDGTAIPAGATILSIGPQTSAGARELFGRVDIEAANAIFNGCDRGNPRSRAVSRGIMLVGHGSHLNANSSAPHPPARRDAARRRTGRRSPGGVLEGRAVALARAGWVRGR